MEYRRLGKTGLKVSALSYGAWVTMSYQVQAVKQAAELLAACREGGCNFFDNAEVYAKGDAEILIGKAIKELGWKRSDVVLSTKLFWGGEGPNDVGLSRKHVVEGCKASLKRMGVEYVDVLFAHRPDPNTPIEETVRAFNFCIDNGWAFYWGTSEWSVEQIQEASDVADRLGLVGPCCEQPQYNLFERSKVEKEFLPLYDSKGGLGLTTWSPLASGVLTGKYSGGEVPAGSRFTVENYKGLRDRWLNEKHHQLEAVDGLAPLAAELGCTMAQLALAWCAKNPNVSTVITGATSVQQVRENFRALDVIPKLTPDVMARVDAIINQAAALPQL